MWERGNPHTKKKKQDLYIKFLLPRKYRFFFFFYPVWKKKIIINYNNLYTLFTFKHITVWCYYPTILTVILYSLLQVFFNPGNLQVISNGTLYSIYQDWLFSFFWPCQVISSLVLIWYFTESKLLQPSLGTELTRSLNSWTNNLIHQTIIQWEISLNAYSGMITIYPM